MSREDPPLRIRLPKDLKERVQALAEGNRRSMNAEIVARLEWSISQGVKPQEGGLRFLSKAARANVPTSLEDRVAELLSLKHI